MLTVCYGRKKNKKKSRKGTKFKNQLRIRENAWRIVYQELPSIHSFIYSTDYRPRIVYEWWKLFVIKICWQKYKHFLARPILCLNCNPHKLYSLLEKCQMYTKCLPDFYKLGHLPACLHFLQGTKSAKFGCHFRPHWAHALVFEPPSFHPLSSDRQHLSYDVCLEVKREINQIIRTVLCCIVYWRCAQAHLDEQFLQFSGLGFVTFHCG